VSIDLRDRIRDVPDFPSEGIVFKDLMPLIADPQYFAETIHQLADWARPRDPALIFGAEARGFIFGAALAYALGAGFIAARKPGKLPRETIEATYALEYGTDSSRCIATPSPRAHASSSSTTCSQPGELHARRWSSSRSSEESWPASSS
jgi:adenine phosphoribosyltransferase